MERLGSAISGAEAIIKRLTFWHGFALVLLIAVTFRFWNLTGPSLTADEAVTAGFARLPWLSIMFDRIDNHPVLSFLIQKAWWQAAPGTELLRIPTAVAGIGTVAAVMLMMRDIWTARAALMVGAVLALSTAHIHYSQDARMYAFLVLGLTSACWGSVGMYRAGAFSHRTYASLYIVGGAVAIHSHLLGLVGMAMIGLSVLAASVLGDRGQLVYWKRWFVANLILLVLALPWLLQIPEAMGTFPGFASARNDLLDAQWFFRNATGLPGLGALAAPIELILYGGAVYGIYVCWKQSRPELAFLLAALVFVYPAIIVLMELRQPIFANRVFLPSVIGVAIGTGIALGGLKRLGLGLMVVLVLGASLSSARLVTSHNTFENYGGAFEIVDAQALNEAPIVTCNHFWAAAIWETRPGVEIYLIRSDSVFRYPGPEYWQAASNGMSNLRGASAETLAGFIGDTYWIRGGLEVALEAQDAAVFIRPFCPQELGPLTRESLEALGFHLEADSLVTDNAPPSPIMDGPQTRVGVYRR